MKKWLLFLMLSTGSIPVYADSAELNEKFCNVLGEIADLSAKMRDFGLSQNVTLEKVNSFNTLDNPILHEKIRRSTTIIVDMVYQEKAKALIPEQLKKATVTSCLQSF